MRTLIVDDNPLMRDTLRSILESLGAHVTEAADGNLGLVRLEEALVPFELIVCDLRMPNRDGIQFLRAMAERDIRAGIILISGHQNEVLSAAANIGRRHALNIIGHLKKPFSRADLRDLLIGFAARDDRPVAPRIDTPVDEADIRRGLAAGEISVVFQPKVDCTSYEIVGGAPSDSRARSILEASLLLGAKLGLRLRRRRDPRRVGPHPQPWPPYRARLFHRAADARAGPDCVDGNLAHACRRRDRRLRAATSPHRRASRASAAARRA